MNDKTYKDTSIMGYPQKTGVYTSTVLNRKRGMNVSDIELVIKIPEEEYKRLVYIDIFKLRGYIGNGTPLPKGHGRIADMDEAIKCIQEVKGEDASLAIALIEWACSKRTIIEAEGEVSDEDSN